MKTIGFVLVALVLASCELTLIDPVFDDRDRITGTYHLEEYSQTYNDFVQYSLFVYRGTGRHEVRLENFYNANLVVWGELRGDKLYIHRQVVNGYEVEGVATLYNDALELNYRVRDLYNNRPTDFCEARAWLR